MEPITLEIRGLAYRYSSPAGYIEAVKKADFIFTPGKTYAIMGRSGSGKTTLLSLIAGLDLPWKGEILFCGKSLTEMDRHKYRRENVGMIFQSYNLLPQLTALENVILSLELSGFSGDKKSKAMELLESVGLSAIHAAKRSTKLSGGEQQRVAIARAIASNPPVLLADEPTGNLDSENSQHIIDLINQLAHKNNTICIIITHSSEVAEQCDVILTMKDGILTV